MEASERLGSAVEARWLAQHASGRDATEWALGLDDEVPTRPLAHFDAMVARRAAGEPIQYVLASWPFRTLELFVDRRVLIPRPETEEVAGVALARLHQRPRREGQPWRAADLGTGSGAIGLSLAAESPVGSVLVWATDASADALDVARANLAGVGRRASGVALAQGSWFAALPPQLEGLLDVVVSNPPYVAASEELPEEVAAWEPAQALVSGPTGLECLFELLAGAVTWLAPGGWVVLEIGATQGPAVAAEAERVGLVDVAVRPDAAGLDRILEARRP